MTDLPQLTVLCEYAKRLKGKLPVIMINGANLIVWIGPVYHYDCFGWGAGIRTPIGRSRVGSPTVERHPNVASERYDTLTLMPCQGIFWAFNDSAKPHPAKNVRRFCSAN